MQRTRRLGIVVALVVELAACASASSQKAGEGAPDTTTKPVQQAANEDVIKADLCVESGKTGGLNLYAQGEGKLKGNELALYTDRSLKTKSLCELLIAANKKVAIFQFAGIDCISCRGEAEHLRKDIETSKHGKDILHVVVLTDKFEDYADKDYKEFMDKWAPKAQVAYDEAKMWKSFSEDPTAPDRATIMAMNRNMDGVVFNKPGETLKIFAAAEKLVEKLDQALAAKTGDKKP